MVDCDKYCKIIDTNDTSTLDSCITSDEPFYIKSDILGKEQNTNCLYKTDNTKRLNIDTSKLFVPSTSNCWNNSHRMGTSTNNIGIIDKYKDKDGNEIHVKKCCEIKNMIVPRSDVAGNKVFVGKCKIIDDNGELKEDMNPLQPLTASHICNINNNKPNNIVSSSETTNFCKAYNCCSNINIHDD